MGSDEGVSGDFSGECDDGRETFSVRLPLELEAGAASFFSFWSLDEA